MKKIIKFTFRFLLRTNNDIILSFVTLVENKVFKK